MSSAGEEAAALEHSGSDLWVLDLWKGYAAGAAGAARA